MASLPVRMDNGPGDYWTDMGCDGELSVPTMTIHSCGFQQPCGFVWHNVASATHRAKQPETVKPKRKVKK